MDPGTALAVVSLSFDLFAGCVRGFVLISDARNIGKDAALERTKLLLQEYRLIEWARAIGLDSPKDDEPPGPNKHPAALVLLQLEQLLSSTEALKKRYKMELVSPPDGSDELVLSETMATPDTSASSILSNIVSSETRKGILERASKLGTANRFPKRLWWAAVDKNKYAELVKDVTGLVDGLWSLLDISHRVQTSRAVNQTLQLAIQTSEDVKGLQDLQKSLQDSAAVADMQNGLAASAGLKAQHILLTSPRLPTVLDPSQLTGIQMISSTIGLALYQGNTVLIEEKRVQPNMKAKLKSRVESLVHLLSQPPTPSFQTFPCLGYTEEQGGFRMVFRYPSSTEQPVSLLSVLSRSSGPLPDVGTRLRLAVQVCQTLLSFHTAGWLHKDVRSENILLISPPSDSSIDSLGRPYLCGFSFARQGSPTEISEQPSADLSRDIYRHAKALGEPSESFERYMDAYSLGCVLIEIAEWTPLRKVVKKRIDTSDGVGVKLTDVALLSQWMHGRYISERVAAFRLGVAFMKMLALCIPGGDETMDLADFYSALESMAACEI
ncbi:prion-inhibition and propagation-domain-containing protein [Dactylonectria estremocensis]|uniref:Prion-inhibition and propagation-domain-containing protein n=1 Tax=Dactylonectria estremocensis TaxID=1079267 RepID=A0A9P9IMU7_9HYPO|nr:prion-inhibition and propagation-domain-containing protein [Dactylonectria estremocensis]